MMRLIRILVLASRYACQVRREVFGSLTSRSPRRAPSTMSAKAECEGSEQRVLTLIPEATESAHLQYLIHGDFLGCLFYSDWTR